MTRLEPRSHPHRRDAVAGMITAIGGVVLFTTARGIGRLPGDTETVGPATFPTALSAILIAAGLVLCGNGLRGKHVDSRDEQEPPVPWRRLLLMVATFAGYCVAFIPVGFLIATGAYLALVTCLVDAVRWKRNLLFALGFSVVIYLTFTQLLAVELPAGVLG
jgi:putative tricarboxylic transport membrane protein